MACFVAIGVFNSYFELGMQIWHIAVVSLFASELELFTGKGLDNISITLGASFLSYMFISFEDSGNYLVSILFTPIILIFAKDKKALTTDGIIAAIAVDVVISIALGNFGFVLLLAFFLGGIITDKIKKKHKKLKQNEIIQSECRDSLQVFANSSVAAVCSVLYFTTNEKAFLVAFVAALGEALADTAASGIGVTVGKAFDPFKMKPCPVGISGGMSVLGTFSSFVGGLLISLIAMSFGSITLVEAVITTICALFGAIFDSFLGSVVQVKYKCRVCGELVEKTEHCNEKTIKHSGFKIVTNDTVNFLGTLLAATLAFLVVFVM